MVKAPPEDDARPYGRRGCNMFHIVLFVFLFFLCEALAPQLPQLIMKGLGSVAASDNICVHIAETCFIASAALCMFVSVK